MAFCIITDSASDIPRSVIDEFQLHVIPTPVTIDEKDYFDGDTIFPDEFYRIQAAGEAQIKTYHISQYMFYEHFKPFAERGDEVLYICFSTGIAGTFQAANLAKEDVLQEYPDFRITIVDSRCASIGFGLVVYKLLRMQRNGADRAAILQAAEVFCKHMKHMVTVDTLDYLYKGGRLSRSSAVIGGMLDIKPIIEVDEKGSLAATGKVRGIRRAVRRCIQMVGQNGDRLDRQIVGVCYGTNREMAVRVAEELQREYGIPEILLTQVGCAIGAHTGPGILGIVCEDQFEEQYEKYV